MVCIKDHDGLDLKMRWGILFKGDTTRMHLFSETRHHTHGSLSSNLGGQPDSKHSTQPHSHLGRPEPHPVIGDVVKPSNRQIRENIGHRASSVVKTIACCIDQYIMCVLSARRPVAEYKIRCSVAAIKVGPSLITELYNTMQCSCVTG